MKRPPVDITQYIPEIRPIYELKKERLLGSLNDYDENGNLKPEAPPEVLDQIDADIAKSNFSSFGYQSSIDPAVWEKFRRPDFGPERNLTDLEAARKTALEEAVDPEWLQMDKHAPMFRRFFADTVLRNTVFGVNKRLNPVAAQPVPQGYINYDTGELEMLPEQELLRLVGYDHLHQALSGN